MAEREVSVTRTIPAGSKEIFELLADPRKHPVIDGSGSVKASRIDAPARLSKGAKFGMDMKLGVPYKITNIVVEYEEGTLIAWRHGGGHRWRWQLRPIDENTTEVTETFDWSRSKAARIYELIDLPARHKKNMERSLARLAEHFSA